MPCEESDPEGIEERAAIMEYDGGLTRKEAENAAARLHGYTDWRKYVKSTASSNRGNGTGIREGSGRDSPKR